MDQAHPKAIITPSIDLILSGGLSIGVLAAVALLSLSISPDLVLQDFVVLTVVLNGTHFMASYRLLYSSKDFARSYPWASVGVPVILLAYGALALGACAYDPDLRLPIQLLLVVASLYLALHYTGQVWGMVATFAKLEQLRFDETERGCIKASLKVLAAWHIVWALRLIPEIASGYGTFLSTLLFLLSIVALALCGCATYMMFRAAHRCKKPLALRVVTPYMAIHVWYAFLCIYPQSIFWVQIFHALQYLPFPSRVELNRATTEQSDSTRALSTWFVYAATLVAASIVVFVVVPWLTSHDGFGTNPAWLVLSAIINIHHYFIDGCIWKISNPIVSKELFAHVSPSER